MAVQVTFAHPLASVVHGVKEASGLYSAPRTATCGVCCPFPPRLHQAMGALGGHDSLDPTCKCPG